MSKGRLIVIFCLLAATGVFGEPRQPPSTGLDDASENLDVRLALEERRLRETKRLKLSFATCSLLEVKLQGLSFVDKVKRAGDVQYKLSRQFAFREPSHAMDHGLRHQARTALPTDATYEVRCQAARDASDDRRRHDIDFKAGVNSCFNDFDSHWFTVGTYEFGSGLLRQGSYHHSQPTGTLAGPNGGHMVPVQQGRTALQCGLFSVTHLQGRRKRGANKLPQRALPWGIFRVSLRSASDLSHMRDRVMQAGARNQGYKLGFNLMTSDIRSTCPSLAMWLAMPSAEAFQVQSLFKTGTQASVSGPSITFAFGEKVGEAKMTMYCANPLDATRHANQKIKAARPTLEMRNTKGKGTEKALSLAYSSLEDLDRASNSCPIVMAHRGVIGPDSPENTLKSLRTLMNTAIDGAEVDVFLVPRPGPAGQVIDEVVLAHDPDLRRTLGIDVPLETLLKTRTVSAVMSKLKCQGLQPLRHLLTAIDKHRPDFFLDIELKPGEPGWYSEPYEGYSERLGRAVGKLLREYPKLLATDRVVVSSFDSTKTRYVNEGFKGESIRTAGAEFTSFKSKVSNFVNNLAFKDKYARARVFHYSLIDKKTVSELHTKHKAVGAYTLYDITESANGPSAQTSTVKKLLDAGVDWIETDDPFRLMHTLHQLAPERCGRYGNTRPAWAKNGGLKNDKAYDDYLKAQARK